MTNEETIIKATRDWVERAVIGLNLCPFAKAAQTRGQIGYIVSHARNKDALSADLLGCMHQLAGASAERLDTILLIHPFVLLDFIEYNDYLDIADLILTAEGYEGVLQVASFHPDYQFADSDADDRANHTNRSPYPLLHLLREESVSRAVDTLADPAAIYQRNMVLLRNLPAEEFEQIWPARNRE